MQTALHVIAFLSIGMVLGAGYFALLHAEVVRLVQGVCGREVILTHLMRLVAAFLIFWLIAQFGAAALIASLIGFTLVLTTLRSFSTS
jgi:N-ATPase, AtpR subunit